MISSLTEAFLEGAAASVYNPYSFNNKNVSPIIYEALYAIYSLSILSICNIVDKKMEKENRYTTLSPMTCGFLGALFTRPAFFLTIAIIDETFFKKIK